MERRQRPVPYRADQPMLLRIDPAILHMPPPALRVPDYVLPIPPLPEPALALPRRMLGYCANLPLRLPCPLMNARLDRILDEARAALSDPDQDRLADLIAAYVATHAAPIDLGEAELAELKRRHEEPFDPAPEDEVRALFARHRG